jgi:hypothetical protein
MFSNAKIHNASFYIVLIANHNQLLIYINPFKKELISINFTTNCTLFFSQVLNLTFREQFKFVAYDQALLLTGSARFSLFSWSLSGNNGLYEKPKHGKHGYDYYVLIVAMA